jgi:hypothetical protein
VGALVAAALPRLDGSKADGVHLLWTPPAGAGYSLDGFDIQRRKASGRPKPQCYRLSGDELEILHRVLRVHTPVAEIAVRQAACPVSPVAPHAVAIGTAPGVRCVAYDIRLGGSHRMVEIHIGVPAALAIALRDGKAVAARPLTAPGGIQSTRFENLDVDQVIVYCTTRAALLEICVDVALSPEQEEHEWVDAELIAKRIQIPIRALDPGLGSQADEDALAQTRLLADEQFDPDAFHGVTELMNEAAAGGAPVYAGAVVREELNDPFVELRPWRYALALLIEPAWRRMLGFGFLDPAAELEEGAAYDYRITGRFRRRDLEQPLHGFHSVPRGTTLPTTFALGPVSLRTPAPATVQQLPEPPEDGFAATGRTGIALSGERCLVLSFGQPLTRVGLELAPGSTLSWRATTTEFLPGLPVTDFGADLPPAESVTIEPADPVDTITLSGSGFLFGVRELPAGSGDPDEVVAQSVVVHARRRHPTPAPPRLRRRGHAVGRPRRGRVTAAALQRPGDPTTGRRQAAGDAGRAGRAAPTPARGQRAACGARRRRARHRAARDQ